MQKMKKFIPIGMMLFPVLSLAAATSEIEGMINYIIDTVLDPVAVLLIAVAVVVFLWGVVGFIKSGDDEAERKKGKDLIVYGIIGLFVMISIWGIVNLLVNTFDLKENIPSIPQYTP